ncbi:hypothetical protein HK096_009042, partial [Nowakowskiella sp. JEL0078]
MWVAWGSRGIYLGTRQIYLIPQIDDLFLSTSSPVIPGTASSTYRVNSADINNIIDWQTDINTNRLASGSDLKLEFAFNGYGSLATVSPNLLTIDSSNNVGNSFVKPLGSGDLRWPVPPPSFDKIKISNTSTIQNDDLFAYLSNPTIQKNFFFVSHTFTHENLNNASYQDTDNELKYNIQFSKLLGLYNSTQFSQNSLVTPQISGIWNGDALQAILDNGITSIVGDDSRGIINPLGFWYPYFTTIASSNFEGFQIIPRSPCEVYFDASTVPENTYIYNTLYSSSSTIDQIMDHEGDRVLRKLLLLHPEPYQFHQPNLRKSPTLVTIGSSSGYYSLVQQWIETVVYKLNQVTNWPVITIKQDDLANVFLKRWKRLSCGINSTLLFDSTNTMIVGIHVSSLGTCEVPITVPDTATYPVGSEAKKIGSQPLVVKLKMSGDSQTIMLGTPINV